MRPHFHVAGFPVRVRPLFFLTVLATGWSLTRDVAQLALWTAVVFVSILAHELGHALAFRRYGSPARIELHGMGGTAHAEDGGRLTHRQLAWVSFAGPGAGFVLGGLVWAAARLAPPGVTDGRVGQVVDMLLLANVGWGLFNLLPFQPLDGGHLLASLVRAWRGYRHERLLHRVGIVTAALVVGYAIWARQLWMGMLALTIGVLNLEQLRRLPPDVALAPTPAREGRQRRRSAWGWFGRRSSSLPRRGPSLMGAVTLDELLGRTAPASPHTAPVDPSLEQARDEAEPPRDPAVVGRLLLDSGLSSLAIRPLQEAFAQAPSSSTGHSLVLALLETGRTEELAVLLSGPRATYLSEDSLEVIALRARDAQEVALADRVTALRRARAPKSDERG
ncbi:M50 family metallopeptidase [Myxococcus stipitatus]|uniref:M50 family metallopeptidase n=1 Tax=Myxococcus stipitatus TaxID=83455 RepID=UPI001F27BE1E|nr:M50 family metallopeptidase [Myxococcus stipitatus]MCE9672650.1 M50 family metallopeptidase [Myxococcus stipitatus]